ncbi:MAG: sodium/solute symporter [Phycisphaerae bacterium]|nr:sodium/solute symporter [Phycisphaerae bacterium]
MTGLEGFQLSASDYVAFIGYFVVLSAIGYLAGRRKKRVSDDYFLAGRSLPWYVVGSSFIASNIHSEQFIGTVGAAVLFGVCAAMFEWGNLTTFSILIWFFIPFLLASRVFTTPEFMERRFNPFLRQLFAVVTVITGVVAFLSGALYGGGLALQSLFGWNLTVAIVVLAFASGVWAIYGGLSSAAWADVCTVVVMVAGGMMVAILGLQSLAPESGSVIEGFRVMIERNRASEGIWRDAVAAAVRNITPDQAYYNRLSVIQPPSHALVPWTSLVFITFTVSIWYNVINQFMIQRVLGAKNMYHARMGIVFAGYLKVLLPVMVVLPGLVLFAHHPEILMLPWEQAGSQADKGYVTMLQQLIPGGLRGLFLAALFGAIQSTVQAVLNSTATVFTLDIYKRWMRPAASDREQILTGRIASVAILALAIVLAHMVVWLGMGLFEYTQMLYAFFAPPFGAVFLLGILSRRINGVGAGVGACVGFAVAVLLKIGVTRPPAFLSEAVVTWLSPFGNQAVVTWLTTVAVCIIVSVLSAPPRPEQVSDDLTFNWRELNILGQIGSHWYNSVLLWWALFVVMIVGLMVVFSGVRM